MSVFTASYSVSSIACGSSRCIAAVLIKSTVSYSRFFIPRKIFAASKAYLGSTIRPYLILPSLPSIAFRHASSVMSNKSANTSTDMVLPYLGVLMGYTGDLILLWNNAFCHFVNPQASPSVPDSPLPHVVALPSALPPQI